MIRGTMDLIRVAGRVASADDPNPVTNFEQRFESLKQALDKVGKEDPDRAACLWRELEQVVKTHVAFFKL